MCHKSWKPLGLMTTLYNRFVNYWITKLKRYKLTNWCQPMRNFLLMVTTDSELGHFMTKIYQWLDGDREECLSFYIAYIYIYIFYIACIYIYSCNIYIFMQYIHIYAINMLYIWNILHIYIYAIYILHIYIAWIYILHENIYIYILHELWK